MTEARSSATTASGVSRYRFVRRLAKGGMAEVFVADAAGAAGVTRRVAVKRILPKHATEKVFSDMFVHEARVASTLQHPNIVQTYDVIEHGGTHYIVMELLEGANLLHVHRLARGLDPGLDVRCALYIVDRVLAGLHYAHERRTHDGTPLHIVHRDVSPHNIFLSVDGGVKLLDFGVSKAEALLEERGTESGVVKGKVTYMPPEQCQGLEIDRRADIWAVGVLLYSLLTGTVPFKGKNPYDTMRAIIHEYPPSPSMVVPSLPAEVDVIVRQALSKDPEGRFASARHMQRAIGEVIRAFQWYLTELEFTGFVEQALRGSIDNPPDTTDLPPDLVISEGDTQQLNTFVTKRPKENGPLAESEHAVVESVGGLTIVRLRGTIDERFRPTDLLPHLEGVVIIDSEAVGRITSYGIRGLLTLFEGAADKLAGVFHMRCSVAMIQQVGMIRRMLAGGKVISFQLPYVDPVSGHTFNTLVAGEEARSILASRKAPVLPCPGFPDRTARFDDDEEAYLCFLDDFIAEPPPHIASVVDALAVEERRRQVEKGVSAGGTEIWIRRPVDEAYRWASVVAGVEGVLVVDLSATPSWTDAGLAQLVDALRREADAVTELVLVHSPAPLFEKLRKSPLRDILSAGSTVRVHCHCAICQAPRRVGLPIMHLDEAAPGVELTSTECPTCGAGVTCVEDLRPLVATDGKTPGPTGIAATPPPPRPTRVAANRRNGRLWLGLLVGFLFVLGAMALLAFVLLVLLSL
ncbi:MAG: serine/threonine protein kinase [Alphaproteobacteria bacterium]|nr:serine/threonine protein kinase [Alphaproteobacteria bacterium]